MTLPTGPPTTDSAMYQTMHRQPADLRRLLDSGWGPAQEAAGLLAPANRLFIVGVGTSYHAALVGEWLFRAVGKDARAVLSFDFAVYPALYPLRPDDAVIVMAHSGTKTYTMRALERARADGATAISVGSLTADHAGSQLVLRTVEREKSAAFTASHSAAMFVLGQVATVLGERNGMAVAGDFRRALEGVPGQVEAVLARQDEVLGVASLGAFRQVYAVGAGPNAATALEVVIKAREAATAKIDALPLEQFLHGPLVTVNADDLAILINVPGAIPASATRTAEVGRVLQGIGARTWLVGQGASTVPDATIFELPELNELISPILAVVPMQIFAYQVAVERGTNPDRFRRDDPHYAEALSTITL
ncbi:MAG TPA: SIS domain-containing protein [Candidatus Dormibacteraeota bacterium]|nr:SIS domain-containing protein [Candidatus Dormibacteraeota bacterium]